jgi:site-specific DNA-methyltransferase (adenine-specific)
MRQAFESVHDGYSADRVVADPDLNKRFLAACQSLGLNLSAGELNRCLFNARKGNLLAGVPTTRRTDFPDLADYQFASEVAVRFLEQRSRVSLDQILCDPELAVEFDALAAQISPGFTSLQYRWAALSLRKQKRLRPELIGHIVTATEVRMIRLDEIKLHELPVEQGIYIFLSRDETLYVGECENLRVRIKKHLDHSDIRAVAHHFWQHGTAEILLEIRVLPETTSTRARRAMEAELIASRRARFNIKRS